MRRGSRKLRQLIAAAAVAAAAASASAAPPPTQPSPPSLYVAPGGSDAGRCTAAAPCGSLDRAYSLAHPGEVVQLAGGSYRGEVLRSPAKQGSGVVTFAPAPGATVAISGELRLDGQNGIELRDMRVGDLYIKNAANVVLRDVSMQFFFVRTSTDVQILGGDVGGIDDGTSPTIGSFAGQPPSKNVLVDGVTFHDITRSANPTSHIECLFVQESDTVTIRDSRFTHCDVMDVYVNPIVGGQVTNLTFENDFFDQPSGGGFYSLSVSPMTNGAVRYDSFSGSVRFVPGAYTNFDVVGNVGRLNNCDQTGVTYSHNVWSNQKCDGTSDVVAPPGYVNAGAFDLHLSPGAAALGAGDPTAHPATDIDRDLRPLRVPPDAGADQRETAAIVLGRWIGEVRIGTAEADVAAFYGRPVRQRTKRYAPSAIPVSVATYAIHAGALYVVSDHGNVVGVGTTSPYYSVANGGAWAGVGVGATPPARGGPLRWVACAHGYHAVVSGADITVAPASPTPGAPIAAVWMIQTPYAPLVCPAAHRAQ